MSYFRTAQRIQPPIVHTPIIAAVLIALMVGSVAASAFAKDAYQPIDRELRKYWDVEIPVPTTTNQTHTHKGAFEAMIGVGVVPNDSYYLPLPITLRAGYHMTESVALEASFSYLGLGAESDLHNFLNEKRLLRGVRKPTHMTLAASIDLMYSPFHGKLGIFDKKISSFDIAMVIGAGVVGAKIDETPDVEDELTSTFLPAGHWGLTLRFFAKEWLTVRVDYRQYAYSPQEAVAVAYPVELTLGVSFFSN